jgi:hypothetical protein
MRVPLEWSAIRRPPGRIRAGRTPVGLQRTADLLLVLQATWNGAQPIFSPERRSQGMEPPGCRCDAMLMDSGYRRSMHG